MTSLSDEQIELQVLQIVSFLLKNGEDQWERMFINFPPETKKRFHAFVGDVEQKYLTARQNTKKNKDTMTYYRWINKRSGQEMSFSEPPIETAIWTSEPIDYEEYKSSTKISPWIYYKWERRGEVEKITKHSAFDQRPQDTRYTITQIEEEEYSRLQSTTLDKNVENE